LDEEEASMETRLVEELMKWWGLKTAEEVERRLDEMKAQRTIIVWNKYEGSTGHQVYQFVLADPEPGAKK
jgi:hypothetical protein